jgi:peroxiredoxin
MRLGYSIVGEGRCPMEAYPFMSHRRLLVTGVRLLVVVLVLSSWCAPTTLAADEEGPVLAPASTADSATDSSVGPASYERRPPQPSPADRNAAFAAGIDEVRRSGIFETAIGVGDRAADFELPEIGGRNLRLSELWAAGPVVLVYYRGGWCPFCNQYLAILQKSLLDIHALDAQLVAVSPELPKHGLATQEKNKLTFPLLSDEGNAVARQYGIVYRISNKVIPYYDQFFDIEAQNGDRSYELPLSATYVIDTSGVVRYAFLDADYKRRADPKEVLAVLRRLKDGSPARPLSRPVQAAGAATDRPGSP